MNILLTILLAVQILSALGMIGLILMQHGKGADAGAAFGGGAGSASLFGASGGANFLSRTTAVLAGVFLTCTLGLAYFGNLREAPSSGSVLEGSVLPTEVPPAAQIPGQTSGGAPAAAVVETQPVGTGAAQIPAK
ncbi:MAG: preprotein translocase subunit SecG [Hydrogenophaga sp.]|jgi:preprotein translocase subunit SecG|uniref:preprotein translocase subunit SecG n=1 Tax=Hydrogenophaga sp. TaxID=1904254 RepID=UPI0027225E54|nr:preprotein translocase subunit SecG [Hydrogenophaga sp.]MDP1953890.1 preprotein translocase subunit SecG [Polaromonas sp.]MDO9199872.1 preprotein translocase subunit SecG [Hydrogenophaga sp.]MDO9479493.1 preprotein translocase subunit SecG [Hydrogenophaga sp.]MDO9569161.1 preprotein translocase subunit SecG [Hydrogenophaga sp.]MDP2221868.1 preprotein translocase subunit SecG [Hydrogenophaga sp.]